MLPIALSLFALAAHFRFTVASSSPSGNYTPSFVDCPTNVTFVRPASEGLSAAEASWVAQRKTNVISALQEYLALVEIPDFDTDSYIKALQAKESEAPVIGMSFSGGGERALLNGLGMYQALDNRYPPAVEAKTGGLLQAMTYLTGLSGGAAAAAILGVNDFRTALDLSNSGNLNGTDPSDSAFEAIGSKAELGFNISFADIFAIEEAYAWFQSSNNTTDPFSLLWSGIQSNPTFINATYPLPILMLNEVIPSELPGSNSYDSPNGTVLLPVYNANQTIYEMTPFEYGSWQGRAAAFADIKYAGTTLSEGKPVNSSLCVEGFDSAAFAVGSAEMAFNLWYLESVTNGSVGQFAKRQETTTSSAFISYPSDEATLEQVRVMNASLDFVAAIPEFLELLGNQTLQESLYGVWPNPFANFSTSDSGLQSQDNLLFVDGSEVGQENPLVPLIQPARNLDFAIVCDNGGTELSSGWMNGTSFINTYEWAQGNDLPFPKIPDVNTMLNLNHTMKPTFFGCNEQDVPLLLYVADFPYSSFNNISFTSSGFSPRQQQILFGNALTTISQNNDNLTANWTTCVACGAILRSLQRLSIGVPDACKTCFEDHCWQGNTEDAEPSFLEPGTLLVNERMTFETWNQTVFYAENDVVNVTDSETKIVVVTLETSPETSGTWKRITPSGWFGSFLLFVSLSMPWWG